MNNDTFKPNGGKPNSRQLVKLEEEIQSLLYRNLDNDRVFRVADLVKEYNQFGDWLNEVVMNADDCVNYFIGEIEYFISAIPSIVWESLVEVNNDHWSHLTKEYLKSIIRSFLHSEYNDNFRDSNGEVFFEGTNIPEVVNDYKASMFSLNSSSLDNPLKTSHRPESTWLEKAERKRNVKTAVRNYRSARNTALSAIREADMWYADVFRERFDYERYKETFETELSKLTKPLHKYARSRSARSVYQHEGAEKARIARENMYKSEGKINDLLKFDFPDVMPLVEEANSLGELWISILNNEVSSLEENPPKKTKSVDDKREEQRKLANKEPISINGVVEDDGSFHFDVLSLIGDHGVVFEGRKYFMEIEGVVVEVSDLRAWLETLLLTSDFETLKKEKTLKRDVDYVKDFGISYVVGDKPEFVTVSGVIRDNKIVFEYDGDIKSKATFLDRKEDLNSNTVEDRGDNICHLAVFEGNGCVSERG